jgi:multiple sugar transport system permease protein
MTRWERCTPVLFLLPSLAGFMIFFILPFFYSLGYAVTDKPVNGSFVGLKNFVELLGNKSYLTSVSNTAFFIGVSLPLSIILSLAAALLFNQLKKGKELITLMFLVPLVIPSGSTVFFWQSFFSNEGYLNSILNALDIQVINWLESEYARIVIIIIFLWKSLGYSIVLFLSALRNIPIEYYEAASLDGAGNLRKFSYITFPYLIPTFLLVVIMALINSFKVFREIYVLTGDYPTKTVYMMQHFMNNMFTALNYQKLTAATCLLVVVIGLATQGLFWAEKRISV